MRSPASVRLTAIGKSALIPLSYLQPVFNAAAAVVLSEDATALTYSVLVTYDDFGPDGYVPVTISQTLTAITVTDPALPLKGGVSVGDVVILKGTNVPGADGYFVVQTTPTPTTYTVTSLVSQSAVDKGFAQHDYWRLFAAPTNLTAATTRQSAPLGPTTTGPVTGVLLNVTALGTGSATLLVVQGIGSG